jgi:hypothetical protein
LASVGDLAWCRCLGVVQLAGGPDYHEYLHHPGVVEADCWRAQRELLRFRESFGQFVGHPAYGLNELPGDLERFVFLLGGSGEDLFGTTVEE